MKILFIIVIKNGDEFLATVKMFYNKQSVFMLKGFPGDSVVKRIHLANVGDTEDLGSTRVWKILREGNGNPLQHSCLRNHMASQDRGVWQAIGYN